MSTILKIQLSLLLSLLLSSTLGEAFAFSQSTSSAINTTARKKLGKKSFIEKQERGQLQTRDIPTSTELRTLATKNSAKKLGSSYYLKGWRHWRAMAIEAIRSDLSDNLPLPADKAKFENLFFRLGVAADKGIMPSFEDAGARSGYALEFFCRARNLADLFALDTFNTRYSLSEEWIDAILATPMLGGHTQDGSNRSRSSSTDAEFNMVSIGGGPGFDFVGLALAAYFNSIGKSTVSPIHATILDYEEGWEDLVGAMNSSTCNVLEGDNKFSCEWGGQCDITKSMNDPINQSCLASIESTQLWTCQYCVAENANLLRESNYIFFNDLFHMTPEKTLFIFTETTPRIWPDLCKVIKENHPSIQAGFCKSGRQMLLRKDSSCKEMMMNSYHTKQLRDFERIVECHERKVSSGYERQQQKVRGSK